MTYETILLVVGVSQFADDLRAAADLCASEGAHLSVLASKIATLPPMGDLAAISAAWIDSRDSDMELLRQAVREARRSSEVPGFHSMWLGDTQRRCGSGKTSESVPGMLMSR
ncbi:Universal stress protein UspA-related nucleotide-binding protein (plasmid) [Sinorhizobium sp. CCBAU 05631]|nr:Universal stress protein UspA-related nucleotide-binding protein [Sinorhizobium sp. CCBAU 05631]